MALPPDEGVLRPGGTSDDSLDRLLDSAPRREDTWSDEDTRDDPAPADVDTRMGPTGGPAGRYLDTTEGVIGRGGMGRVDVVHDRLLGRTVARKLLEPASGVVTSAMTSRFLREARVTARLEHPGIVPVHDLLRLDDGRLVYTMKRVRGRTLADALAQAADPEARLVLLGHVEDVCNALAFAHTEGVVHRDLKPANVLIGAFGETVVIDWGLARVDGEQEERHVEAVGTQAPGLTRDGHLLGTPRYMSPEQAQALHDEVDARTDVWALGLILRELLTGEPPHGTGEPEVLLQRARRGRLPPTASLAPWAPRPLCAIADKATARRPEERYRDAGELAADVAAWRAGAPVAAHRYGLVDQVARLVNNNRRAAAVAAIAVLMGLILSGAYTVRLAAAMEVASQEKRQAEQAEQAAHVSMLQAAAGRAAVLGHLDRELALLWAASESDAGQTDALRAELARAVSAAWPQSVLQAGDTPVAQLLVREEGSVVGVLRDGRVVQGDADGLSPSPFRASLDASVLALAGDGLVGAEASGSGLSAWARDADGAERMRWSVPGRIEAHVALASADGGMVVGTDAAGVLLLAADGSHVIAGRDEQLAQVDALAMSTSRRIVYSAASLDPFVRRWSWPDGSELPPVDLGTSATRLVVADGSDRLISLDQDGVLRGHTLAGEEAWSVGVGRAARLALSPDGTLLAVQTRSGTVRVHHTRDGELAWARSLRAASRGPAPAFQASGSRLAVPIASNGIAVLEMSTGEIETQLGGGVRSLSGLAFDGAGGLWTAGEDGVVRRFSVPEPGWTWTWRGSGAVLTAAAPAGDGDGVLIGDADGTIHHVDAGGRLVVLEVGSGRRVCALGVDDSRWRAVLADACGAGDELRRHDDGDVTWQVVGSDGQGGVERGPVRRAQGAIQASVDPGGALVLHDGCVSRAREVEPAPLGCVGEAPGWRARQLRSTPDGGAVVALGGAIIGLAPTGEPRFMASPRLARPAPDGAVWAVTTTSGLGIMDALSGVITPLVELDGVAQALAWDPDSEWLAWSEEGQGVGVVSRSGDPVRGHVAHVGSVEPLAIARGGAWAVGIDEHGHLLGWHEQLTDPVSEVAGTRTGSVLSPLPLEDAVVRFTRGGAAALPAPRGLAPGMLFEAAASRTPWRACPRNGDLRLVPGAPTAQTGAACGSPR